MKSLTFVFALICAIWLTAASGQETSADPAGEQAEPANPLTNLGTEYQNSIRLLRNRFRIDYEVDELTMVFFRQFGSAPVVLVKPDGSKIFSQDANGLDLFWYDDAGYDMISIKKPTPGPWQAVGNILPDSRVMVISDIQLNMEPLPRVIFSGEIIKQTGYLTNAGQVIKDAQFRDVVELNIDFQSTNNPNENNFGADKETIAVFEDNGLGLDERPLDGIFTGQFNLAIAHGEWRPIFYVTTPMFTREEIGENILLRPNPIQVSVNVAAEGEDYHQLIVDADREYVDINSILVDGKVRFPNLDEISFSLTELGPDPRVYDVVNFEFGIHRVKLTVYGRTKDGRDFILDVPEYTFLVDPPAPDETEAEPEQAASEGDLEAVAMDDNPEAADGEPEAVEDEGISTGMLWLIIGVNLGLLIIGAAGIWWVLRDKKPKVEEDDKEPSEDVVEEAVGEPIERSNGNDKGDPGIVDLSMPEE